MSATFDGVASVRPTIGLALSARTRGRLLTLVLIGALVFNLGLCFANTNVLRVNDTMVMLAELLLIATALGVVAVAPGLWLPLVMLLFLSYMALILSLRPALDLKPIRDFLIPIVFYAAGRRSPDIALTDRVAWLCGLIVLGFGLFEYFFLDVYTKYFNVIQYYIARGTVVPTGNTSTTSTLFASGTRPDARNILPFLGPHRVSSVFLEPVSAGNFGAILYMWALFRAGMRRRWQTMAFGIAAIILSDSRFGAYACGAATGLHLFARGFPRFLWFALPFAVLLALAYHGFTSEAVRWDDNLVGRLWWTAHLVTSLDGAAVFGISPNKPFLSDSGYAYTLNDIGIVGFLAVWALFIFLPERNRDAWSFKMQTATYICLLLLVSDSPYSIKTAALLWFMVGSADGAAPGPDGRIARAAAGRSAASRFRLSAGSAPVRRRAA
ncbi:UDP-phosphate alpha N-acetylglucosaminyltransferase [Methyloraptor flagellatus]|uniref:UDP-phosphate alpha N-acetylglucosaminyltransferase n=1 Tax=Methyloraptor flagellatus TaxID=3162530 RepID=A0AAU7X9P0_9HYPH